MSLNIQSFKNLLLLEGNTRPEIVGISIKPTLGKRSRPSSASRATSSHTERKKIDLNPPIRLRLQDAFDNAEKNRSSSVFIPFNKDDNINQYNIPFVQRKKNFATHPTIKYSNDIGLHVSNLLKPDIKTQGKDPDFIIAQIRGDEAELNRKKGRGAISFASEMNSINSDIQIRCRLDEAINNFGKDKYGVGMKTVMGSKDDPFSEQLSPHVPRIKYDKAEEIYNRDHCMDKGNMLYILNRSKNSKNPADSLSNEYSLGNHLHKGPISSHDMNSKNMSAIIHRTEKVDVNEQLHAPRSVTNESLPNLVREGVSMAEILGERPFSSSKLPRHLKDFSYETKIAQRPERPKSALGPRVKFEASDLFCLTNNRSLFLNKGIENEMNSRGQSMRYLLEPKKRSSESILLPNARVKFEGVPIAESHKGFKTKALLTDSKIGAPHEQNKRAKSIINSRIVRLSRGNAMKECMGTPKKKLLIKWK